jgi:very-short-patch-repair endonuclease
MTNSDKSHEFLILWCMLAPLGLAEPKIEYPFDAELGRKHRADFAFVAQKLLVEVDGNAWGVKGGGRHGKDADNDKMNFAAMLGWRVMHFSPKKLKDDPAGCVELVVKALNAGIRNGFSDLVVENVIIASTIKHSQIRI